MKILVASHIDALALQQLEREHDVRRAFDADEATLRSAIRDREVLIFRSGVTISRAVLEAAPQLQLIVRAGSGLDNIDLEAVEQRGIPLVRAPGPGAQAVAEFTIGLALTIGRHITLSDRFVRAGHWPKPDLGGLLLRDSTLGIVGAGNIGSRVGQLGAAIGMRVVGCVAHPTEARRRQLADLGIELLPFEQVIAAADVLSINTPLNDSTRGLIAAPELSRMKRQSLLVNTSRGGVVDENALYQALLGPDGPGAAALDVHEREGEGVVPRLAVLPNVVLTPHIGAMAIGSQRAIGREVVATIEAMAGTSAAEAAYTRPGSATTNTAAPAASVG